MKKTAVIKIVIVLLIATVCMADAYAQTIGDAFGFEDDNTNDIPEAPIHFLVYLGLVIGGYLGIKRLKK